MLPNISIGNYFISRRQRTAADAVVSAGGADLGKAPAEVWWDLDSEMAPELGRVDIDQFPDRVSPPTFRLR